MTRSPSNRLHFLDGLRGLAATLVVVHHFNLVGETTLPGAYLSVDFFFALSGLVLALAYEDRLRGTMTVAKFTELRVLRLYPLYLAGVALGVGRELAKIVVHDGDAWPWMHLIRSGALAAFMLPDPFLNVSLYPLNQPAWSLLFELLVNVMFALLLVRLASWSLVVLTGAALAVLAGFGMVHGSFHYGHEWTAAWIAIARVTAMFTLGVLCARASIGVAKRRSWWTIPPLLAFLAALAWPWTAEVRWLPDLLLVGVATPALLLFGTRFDVPERLERVFGWLGDISYPIYATHAPLLFCWHLVARRLGLSLVFEAVTFTAFMLVVATALVPIDARVRATIGRWLHLRRSAMPQVVGKP